MILLKFCFLFVRLIIYSHTMAEQLCGAILEHEIVFLSHKDIEMCDSWF